MKKRILALILILATFFTSTVFAVNQPNTIIEFSKRGNKYIYSNNPEQIDSTTFKNMPNGEKIGGYSISQIMTANEIYDIEFNHKNYTGYDLFMGVMLCNTNSTPKTVRVYGNNACEDGTNYITTAANVQYKYWTGGGYTDVTIPANSVKFVCTKKNSNGMIQPIRSGNNVIGKVLVKPLSSGIYCKIAFVRDKYLNSAISVPAVNIRGNAHATALFSSDTRYAVVPYLKNKLFYLSLYEPSVKKPAMKNKYEYELPIRKVSGTADSLWGNYGINYFLMLQGAAGKKLRITPDWTSVHSNGYHSQKYLFYNGSSWSILSFADNTYKDIVIAQNCYIKFLLPGGNTGNVSFKFIN